jgi:5-methylcytosine-specific restriction endonuclease McrA
MIKRKYLSPRRRLNLLDMHNGKCVVCGLPIGRNAWVVEHIRPLSMGGADELGNMGPAHVHCARDKTAIEAGPRAKADRQRAAHLGANVARRPMPGSRASEWKNTFGQGWVKR